MAYSTIQDEGSNLTQRSTLNFVGDTVTASDNSGASRTDVNVSAVRLQASSPGTAQTGHYNIDTGIGRAAVQDKGGQVFNVKAYGAVGNGTADDTTPINNAITAATALASPYLAGIVYFPPGIYKTSGGHTVSSHLKIRGAGPGATIINVSHATNDVFSASATLSEFELSNLGFDSILAYGGATRTGGWVLNSSGMFGNASVVRNVYVRGQFNGFQLKQFSYCWLLDIHMDSFDSSGGTAVKVGQPAPPPDPLEHSQGAGLTIRGLHIDDNQNGNLSYGLVAEDCDAIYGQGIEITGVRENALKLTGGTNYGVHNSSFQQ